MNIDDCKHSLFGASKLSADIYCQEYIKYFNLKIGIFGDYDVAGAPSTAILGKYFN